MLRGTGLGWDVILTSEEKRYCHAWELLAPERRGSFRLPSVMVREFVLEGDRVAICLRYDPSLVLWDLKTQATRTIAVPDRSPLTTVLYPGEDRLSLIQFCCGCNDNACKKPSCPAVRVVAQKYGFGTTAITPIGASTDLHLPRDLQWIVTDGSRASRTYGGIAQILASVTDASKPRVATNRDQRSVLISHSLKTNRTTLHIFSEEAEQWKMGDSRGALLMARDLIYDVRAHNGTPQIWIVHPDQPVRPLKSEITEITESGTRDGWIRIGPWMTFGDADFLGLVTLDGLEVWCFDPDVAMLGTDPTYDRARRTRAEARAQGRQSRS
jgi:hypothetical protein